MAQTDRHIDRHTDGHGDSMTNLEGHQNCIIGSTVTAISLNRGMVPIGGAASGRVCAWSLVHIQLVYDVCIALLSHRCRKRGTWAYYAHLFVTHNPDSSVHCLRLGS